MNEQPSSTGDFDFYAYLLDLPAVFGTDFASIPRDVPYVHAEAARVARWAPRIGGGPQLRVGVVWAGNRAHENEMVVESVRVHMRTGRHVLLLLVYLGLVIRSAQARGFAQATDMSETLEHVTIERTGRLATAWADAFQAPNWPPALSGIPDQTVAYQTPTASLPFTVGDSETCAPLDFTSSAKAAPISTTPCVSDACKCWDVSDWRRRSSPASGASPIGSNRH